MNDFITILYMILIGAAIGGYTNSLAIKMLFRPYRPIYLGKWKLPFTPGLIPKRRDELAVQLGKMVVDHLLTPESIKKKILNDHFQTELTHIAQAEVVKLLDQPLTLADLMERMGLQEPKLLVRKKLSTFLLDKYEQFIGKYRHESIGSILPEEIQEKAKGKIPDISELMLQKASEYFQSAEGVRRVDRMLGDFVRDKGGMLGNMLQMFLGNVNLTDKIQPEIIKFLGSDGTKALVSSLLEKEWEKLLERETGEFEDWLGKDQLRIQLAEAIENIISVDQILDTPIANVLESYREPLMEVAIPKAVQLVFDWASSRIETIIERLQMAEIVREQVETFSLERLEEMLLSITRSELKMITYLGALLGGVIGLFQGILSIMLN